MPEDGATAINLGTGLEENLHRQHRFLEYFRGCRRVVDLGSGAGGFLQRLTRDGVDVICVDSCPEAVRHCRRRGLCAVCADAIEFLAGHRQGFDGVWCAHLIEHLPPPRAEQMVREAYAALHDPGILIVLTPNAGDVSVMGESFREDPTHVWPYTAALLQGMLVSAGFGIEDAGEMPVAWIQSQGWLKRLALQSRDRASRALIGRHSCLSDIFVIARKGEAAGCE